MTRPWIALPFPARCRLRLSLAGMALALAGAPLAAPPPARAQAGIEAATLTQQPIRTLGEYRSRFGPDWSPAHDPALQSEPRELGAQRRYNARGGPRAPAGPARVARPASGAPGRVAGLVYDRTTRVPLAYVTVFLASTEPQYVPTTLTARTDSAGYYEFTAVEPGRWSLGIAAEGLTLHDAYAPPRDPRIVTLARKERFAAPPFALGLKTCVEGHTVWGDGYTLFDAPLTVVPLDSTLAISGGRVNGIGDYALCDSPDDSVMVWMHLRDGRSLGRTTRLVPGARRRVDFRPEPLERMEGAQLRILPVLADGTPVPRAQVTIVGRRFEQGDRPALVFVREQRTDGDGVAEFRAPFGVYEVLAINPREGQTGSERIVVDVSPETTQPLRVVLRGKASAAEQAGLRRSLLERAETSLYAWAQ